jgi:hypothetical protein
MKLEIIEWVTDGTLPDDDITVLIESEEVDGVEVWFGFRTGGEWMTIDGMPVDVKVVAWADMPAGSRAQW